MSSRTTASDDSVRLQSVVHKADRSRFYSSKTKAQRRLGRELTNGDFLMLLLDVYDLHLDGPNDTGGSTNGD